MLSQRGCCYLSHVQPHLRFHSWQDGPGSRLTGRPRPGARCGGDDWHSFLPPPSPGQLPRAAYGPREHPGTFVSGWTCKQMTGWGEVACGSLMDQQSQQSPLGLPSAPILPDLPCLVSPTPSGIQEIELKGRGPWSRGAVFRGAACCAAQSHPLRSLGLGWGARSSRTWPIKNRPMIGSYVQKHCCQQHARRLLWADEQSQHRPCSQVLLAIR